MLQLPTAAVTSSVPAMVTAAQTSGTSAAVRWTSGLVEFFIRWLAPVPEVVVMLLLHLVVGEAGKTLFVGAILRAESTRTAAGTLHKLVQAGNLSEQTVKPRALGEWQ